MGVGDDGGSKEKQGRKGSEGTSFHGVRCVCTCMSDTDGLDPPMSAANIGMLGDTFQDRPQIKLPLPA